MGNFLCLVSNSSQRGAQISRILCSLLSSVLKLAGLAGQSQGASVSVSLERQAIMHRHALTFCGNITQAPPWDVNVYRRGFLSNLWDILG